MVILADTIITISAVLAAIIAIFSTLFAIYKWYLRMGKLNDEVAHIKQENAIMCYAMSSCLDGLIQLGANHTVPEAKEKLDKYLNKQAHDLE